MIGGPLKSARLDAGLTQEELAFKARLSRNYVSMVELNHKSPTVRVLFQICRVLNIKPSTIIARAERASGKR